MRESQGAASSQKNGTSPMNVGHCAGNKNPSGQPLKMGQICGPVQRLSRPYHRADPALFGRQHLSAHLPGRYQTPEDGYPHRLSDWRSRPNSENRPDAGSQPGLAVSDDKQGQAARPVRLLPYRPV